MKSLDFIALGRAAVDLYGEQIGGRLEDMRTFAKYLGGCAGNIAVGGARLGLRVGMITRVGDEHMGRFVRETLEREGVDASHVVTDPARLTGLVILGIRDRETFPLIFFRENCADMALVESDADADFIARAKALVVTGTHFSSPSTNAVSRLAMSRARAAGTKVVLDIDYRPVLWGLTGRGAGEQRFVASDTVTAHLQGIVAECDLVVGTEEEFHVAGGSTDTMTALRALRNLTTGVFVVKRGPRGCSVFEGVIPESIGEGQGFDGFPVEVFNVLGAGDAFMAGLLRGWLRDEPWAVSCRYANACGALVVSRHGCAPAMPSAAELEDYVARALGSGIPAALHDDPRAAQLHRSTTGRRPRPQVFALAFDHRHHFEALADRLRKPRDQIARFKNLIADALLELAPGIPGAGAIVDDRYGREVLHRLGGCGLWLARPVEKRGAPALDFEAGDDAGIALRDWPAEQAAKFLIRLPGEEARAEVQRREERLQQLWRACCANGLELLLEAGAEGPDAESRVIVTVERTLAMGVRADWWKLPPVASPEFWTRCGAIIRASDPHSRGMLVLGQSGTPGDLHGAFAAAAAEPLVRGFAVGRIVWEEVAEDWFADRATDRAARARIAERYMAVVAAWQRRAAA